MSNIQIGRHLFVFSCHVPWESYPLGLEWKCVSFSPWRKKGFLELLFMQFYPLSHSIILSLIKHANLKQWFCFWWIYFWLEFANKQQRILALCTVSGLLCWSICTHSHTCVHTHQFTLWLYKMFYVSCQETLLLPLIFLQVFMFCDLVREIEHPWTSVFISPKWASNACLIFFFRKGAVNKWEIVKFFSINIKMYGRMNFKIFWEKK